MKSQIFSAMLSDNRLHLQHGPIDLIIKAKGDETQINRAYQQALDAFTNVLDNLVAELPLLRNPIHNDSTHKAEGKIAQAMIDACKPYSSLGYITPMAAVAGAVADDILQELSVGCSLDSAYVNNGGDIAVRLFSSEADFTIAICTNPRTGKIDGSIRLNQADNIGGIATSGWHGRSHSLGIADCVTILAKNAAMADAAATMIANAIDLPNETSITRKPACDLSPDSDLQDRLVTTHVAPISSKKIGLALAKGVELGNELHQRKLLESGFLVLQNHIRIIGHGVHGQHYFDLPTDALYDAP